MEKEPKINSAATCSPAVKILLDENMPESLVAALARLGHQVDSVNQSSS